MENREEISFEEIFEQNKNRIHYHIWKLQLDDPHNELFVEGLYALWIAYKKYEPDKGPLSTYFNYTIRNHLIDQLRKKTLRAHREPVSIEEERDHIGSDDPVGDIIANRVLWEEVKAQLTDKQWKWVQYYVIQKMPIKEIAQQENVSVEAVKSWGKQVRKKLRETNPSLRSVNLPKIRL